MSGARSRQSSSPVKMPRPFSLNIFKAPTMASSAPYSKFQGQPPQPVNNSGWFPSQWSLFNSHVAQNKPPSYAPYVNAGAMPRGDPFPNHSVAPNSDFYIFPSSYANGAYVYQPSNKSEHYSGSDYDSSSFASFTPSSSVFSPSLSSTDSFVTSSSSSPNQDQVALPSYATPAPQDNNTRLLQGQGDSARVSYPSSGRNEDGSRYAEYAGHIQPRNPDAFPFPTGETDQRTLLNTEFNSKTSQEASTRAGSANVSYFSSDQHSEVSSHPSDIILGPPLSTSPERSSPQSQLVRPGGRFESSLARVPSQSNTATANKLSIVPLPPLSAGSPSPPDVHRRDSAFMPYYFPTNTNFEANYPEQYISQNSGGSSLPLPPGLSAPRPDASTSSNFSDMRILSYQPSEGSNLHDRNAEQTRYARQARDGHVPPPSELSPEREARRSYASVAAAAAGQHSSSSSSETLHDQQYGSRVPSFPYANINNGMPIPHLPLPSPPLPLSSSHRIQTVPPIPIPPTQLRRSPDSSTLVGGSRQDSTSPTHQMKTSPPVEPIRSSYNADRDFQERGRFLEHRSSSSISPQHFAAGGSGTLPVSARLRKDSLLSTHINGSGSGSGVPKVLPTQTPSTPVRELTVPPRNALQRRYSADDSTVDVTTIPPAQGLSSQRRRSDGDQMAPRAYVAVRSNSCARTVRWTDNLICPSPIFPEQRRKGWFNRRGDQLWTNGGTYRAAEAGMEYPIDLEDYPEEGDGWMNEHGVRIDMMHHLIPKVPKRSALKNCCK